MVSTLLLLGIPVSFLHIYEDSAKCNVTRGIAIVIRLKGGTSETGIIQRVAGAGKLDTLIHHRGEADGYSLNNVLLPGLFFFQ